MTETPQAPTQASPQAPAQGPTTFTELGLRDAIQKNLDAAGHTTPTEIQALALPPALAGKDLIACAQTGGGKTAVFALPILNSLTHSDSRNPRALILVPTRELAVQVETQFALYGKGTGLRSGCIHGDISQNQRERVLSQFRTKRIDVLVATDVAARGIDVPHITHVINYDVPVNAEDYIHRIGRTGRAGRSGKALTFVTHGDTPQLRAIEKLVGQRLDPNPVDPNENRPGARQAMRHSNGTGQTYGGGWDGGARGAGRRSSGPPARRGR